ncbi:MAG: SapC family protein [Pseudomonadota bacterium]
MKKPLFYNNIIALNTEAHRELRLSTPPDPLGFARDANLIPALVDEFAMALGDLAVAFLPGAEFATPVFVAGLHPGTNVFISDDGRWDGRYAPAYLRRYPFILAEVPDGDPVLCVDESYAGLSNDEGTRFFNEKGEAEEPLKTALQLAESYRAAAARTDEFAKKLKALDVLTSVSLDATTDTGEKTSIHGLLVVNEEAVNGLSGEQLAELNADGFLKPIFAHLMSLSALSRLNPSRSGGDEAVTAKNKVEKS